jgi:hypothetical protein
VVEDVEVLCAHVQAKTIAQIENVAARQGQSGLWNMGCAVRFWEGLLSAQRGLRKGGRTGETARTVMLIGGDEFTRTKPSTAQPFRIALTTRPHRGAGSSYETAPAYIPTLLTLFAALWCHLHRLSSHHPPPMIPVQIWVRSSFQKKCGIWRVCYVNSVVSAPVRAKVISMKGGSEMVAPAVRVSIATLLYARSCQFRVASYEGRKQTDF